MFPMLQSSHDNNTTFYYTEPVSVHYNTNPQTYYVNKYSYVFTVTPNGNPKLIPVLDIHKGYIFI